MGKKLEKPRKKGYLTTSRGKNKMLKHPFSCFFDAEMAEILFKNKRYTLNRIGAQYDLISCHSVARSYDYE